MKSVVALIEDDEGWFGPGLKCSLVESSTISSLKMWMAMVLIQRMGLSQSLQNKSVLRMGAKKYSNWMTRKM